MPGKGGEKIQSPTLSPGNSAGSATHSTASPRYASHPSPRATSFAYAIVCLRCELPTSENSATAATS
jgi:hypothetical protein